MSTTQDAYVWSSSDSVIGWIGAVTGPRGLRYVTHGSSATEVEASISSRIEAQRNDERLQPTMDLLRAISEGDPVDISCDLDIDGTDFQMTVWRELLTIPYGTTRSYSEIAAAVGNPLSVRAVAGACARNNLPLVIPCHRVIRSDGSISGFAWGVSVKQHLLDVERAGVLVG